MDGVTPIDRQVGDPVIGPKLERPTAADEKRAYEEAAYRDAGRCVKCHHAGDLQMDHRRNRSQGGWTVTENLQALCGPSGPNGGCHKWLTEHPEEAYREGWAVPSWAHWRSYPARRWVATQNGTYRLAWGLYRDRFFIEIPEAEAADRRAGLIRDESDLI